MAHAILSPRRHRALYRFFLTIIFCVDLWAAEEPAITEPQVNLERLRRLAEIGQHAEVIAECEILLASPVYTALWKALGADGKPTAISPAERERREGELAKIFSLRNQSAAALAAGDAERLHRLGEEWEEAADRFGRMLKPQRAIEAHYEAARAFWIAGKPRLARDILARVQKQSMPATLEADICRLLAEVLFVLAQEEEAKAALDERAKRAALRRRDAFYEESLKPLRRISMYCSASPHHGWAEIALIETLMRLGRYAEAASIADGFLHREVRRTALRARTLVRRGECSRHLGDAEAAARFFREALESGEAEVEVSRDALCGLGMCYGHLSRFASGEEQRRMLRLGRAILTDALSALSPSDGRRGAIAYLLAELSLADSAHGDAEELASGLINETAWRFRAAYLRSQALREQGKLAEGRAQLQALLRWTPATESDAQIRQKALRALGEIELAAGDGALALFWFKRAGDEARSWRDESAMAEADLGAAKSLIALAQVAAAGPPKTAGLLAAGLGLALGCADAVEAANIHLQRWRFALAPGASNLDAALALLQRLAQHHGARIRHDDIAYWRGLALLCQADAAHRVNAHREEDIVRFYKNAAEAFAPAVEGNPLSPWALAAGLLMAEAHHRQARFLFEIAAKWRRQNAHAEAQIRVAAGKQALAAALQTLAQSLKLPGSSQQHVRARQLRGEIYFDLEEFDKAAEEFKSLARQSDLGIDRQREAARQWSRALERQGKLEEALQPLLPYIRYNAQTAIQAGLLWEALGRWSKAYEAYHASLEAEADATIRAESRYRLHALALQRVEQLWPGTEEKMRHNALNGLTKIIRDHWRTPWAVEALLFAGEWYLARDPQEALRLGADVITEYGDQPLLKQAGKLLEGKALLRLGKAKEAHDALQEAETLSASEGRSRWLQAAAIHGQGDAMVKLSDRQAAMRYYSRVLTDYPEIDEISDLCRASLAQCLAEDGKVEEAIRLLEAGKNRLLMQQARENLPKQKSDAPAAGK